MSDLSTMMGTDPAPATTEPAGVPGMPPPGTVPGSPQVPDPGQAGAHPLDQSVPLDTIGRLVEPDRPPSTGPDHLGPQGQRTKQPWSTENEDAIPINQRAAHDWSGRVYTVNTTTGPIQFAGRLRGCVTTRVWVPSTSAFGVMISPVEGDIQQGVGLVLNPGDSIDLPTEGPIWGGVINPNASGGPVQVARFFNPPGGGLGLTAA